MSELDDIRIALDTIVAKSTNKEFGLYAKWGISFFEDAINSYEVGSSKRMDLERTLTYLLAAIKYGYDMENGGKNED